MDEAARLQQHGRKPTAFEAYLRSKRGQEGQAQQSPGLTLGQVAQAGLAVKPSHAPAPRRSQQQQTQQQPDELSSLAEAASSLARAARSLAGDKLHRKSAANEASHTAAANVQASYDALAAAAQQLALNVTAQRCAVVSPFSGDSDQQHHHSTRKQQMQQQGQRGHTGLAALQEQHAGLVRQHLQAGAQPQQQPSSCSNTLPASFEDSRKAQAALAAPFNTQRAQPVVSAGRTSTPSFAPLNPVVALLAHSKRPGSSAGSTASPVADPGKRPVTANPITHSLNECPPTASRSSMSRQQQPQAAAAWAQYTPVPPGPGDEGSAVAQVLTLPPRTPPEAGSIASAGGNKAQAGSQDVLGLTHGLPRDIQLNPTQLYLEAPELLRMEKWPPTTPITVGELQDDSLSRSLNALLAQLRERIRNHGCGAMERSFRLADADGSGELDVSEFRNVLERGLNLDLSQTAGVSSTAAEAHRALDALMRGLDQNQDGRINFVEFINALKSNQLPYQTYNRRFRHRAGGNPDQPFGPSNISVPYGTLPDAERNTQQVKLQMQGIFEELQHAFQAADANANGMVSRKQFAAALRSIDTAHKLALADTYIQQLFRDSDPEFTGAVDYRVFLQAFQTGGPGARFVPEFMLPQSLRCSQLGPPWEWKDAPSPGARRPGALAPPLTAVRKISAGLPLATPSSKAAASRCSLTAPATPLTLPGTKLLRRLDA